MKRIFGIVVAMLALAAAQPAAGQVVVTDCMVSGGGLIVAANGDDASFGVGARSDRLERAHQLYVDHGPATELTFRSLVTTALVCNLDARRAEIIGTGQVFTDAGPLIVEYRISLFIPSTNSSVPDSYRITLSNGYDSGEQPVERGNLFLRAL